MTDSQFPERITIGSNTTRIQVRYSETDKGGVVHNSVYPDWFEIGRTELLRANKVSYKSLEDAGIFFVVAELNVKYRRPAYYDDIIDITAWCSKVTASRIEHSYRLVRKSDGVLIADGKTVIACIRQGKVSRIPEFMYPAD